MKKINFFSIAFMLILSSSAFAQIAISNATGGAITPNATTTNRNVGIGTTNPTAALHIQGGVNTGQLPPNFKLDRNDGTNQAGVLTLGISSNGFSAATLGGGSAYFKLEDPYGNSSNSDMAFSTNGATPQLTIKHSGNIGIGTITPLQKLHLLGSQFIDNGNLGIGISAPSNSFSKLQVHNGAIMVSGSNVAGGPMICFSDNIASTAYPNGRWGIEYTSGGLNFWQPWNPTPGGGTNFHMFLKDDGKVGIGVDPTACGGNSFAGSHKLYVNGSILSTGLKVANFCSANWADYVFEDNYNLKSLNEVEKFIIENKHLPNIPSAMEIEKEGLDVAQMQAKQMEKIEELTLYLIEMKKEIDQLKKENAILKNEIKKN